MKLISLTLLGYFLLRINFAKSEPRFTSEPEDFTGFQDKFRSLSSEVGGAVNPSFQWYHNGTELNHPTAYDTTKKKVLFFETTLESQGIYQLFVSSKMGRIFGREIKVEFTVVGEFLEHDKKTRNVVIGEKFELACPKHRFTQHAVYKWGWKEATGTRFFEDKPNALVLGDGRLFFSHITEDDVQLFTQNGGVQCFQEANIGDEIRLKQSGPFLLNSTGVSKTSFGPTVVEIRDKEVVDGSTVLLRCIAAGYPTPTYEWKYTNQLGETKTVFDKVDGVQLLQKNKILAIEKVTKDRHAGTYTCKATINDNGSDKTAEEMAVVTIREKPSWVEGKNINSATPDIHAQYSWKCLARGDPEPEYKWYANATIMNNVSGRHTIEGGILTFHRLTPEDDGMYQCVAKNKFGFAYQTVSLKVKVKPPTITRLSEENFVVGNTGLISCVSDALPAATHHWLFNGTKLEPNKTTKYDLTSRQDLLVHHLTQSDTGIYTCEATNPYGRETKDKFTKVAEIVFKRRPKNNTHVTEGKSFSLFCEAESDPPLNIAYRWNFQGKEVKLGDGSHRWDPNTHTLTVSNAKPHESGVYECTAYSATTEKRSSATVIVRGLPDPPEKLTLHGTCANFTANLTWVIPYRSSYEPLTRMLIQWRPSRDTSMWYNFSDHVSGSANGYEVKGLNPYSDILFRVIAINENGMGKPSNVTEGQKCQTPQAKPSVCPTNVSGNSTHPHDINITWQNVEPLYHNGAAFGYVVLYRPRGSSDWKTEVIRNGSKPTFTIYNTSANQLWEVQVRSSNNKGYGPECPTETVRSGMEAQIMFKMRLGNKTDVLKGSKFSLRCEAYSKPLLTIYYKWLHQGKETGQTGNLFTVSESQFKDSGSYECVAYVKTSIYQTEKSSRTIVIVRGPPDAPRDLTITGKCSNFSANLTWITDRISYQPLTNFIIQWSTTHNSGTWYNLTDHVEGSANGHVVQKLNPYSEIAFRIIAVNKHGQSKPSDRTAEQECKTPAAKPTTCPTDVKGSPNGPGSIIITWKEVPQLYHNGPEFAYNVSYRKFGDQWQHDVVQRKESFTTSKAGVGQVWEFRVDSTNAEGNGPECQTQNVTTAREKPKLAPQSLRYKKIGSDYVELEWSPVDALGIIDGYKLSYWYKTDTTDRVRRSTNLCTDENNPCTTKISNPAARNYTLKKLKPFKKYTIFLQAYNDAGDGPASEPLTLTTKQGRPGPPQHAKVTPFGRYLRVTWKPPSEPNGVITGYLLRIVNGTNDTVDEDTTMYLFDGLQPMTNYVIQINAKTSAGVGEYLEKVEQTTEVRVPAIPSPPGVLGIDKESVNVTYNPSSKPGGFPEKFYIVYKEEGQDDNQIKKTNVTLIKRNGEKSYIIISGLKNDKRYLFATVVINEGTESDRSSFTEGHPLAAEKAADSTPVYRQYWFYIILAIILLLLLLLVLLLLIRRKPKQTYKVSEREKKKRAMNGSMEMGEEHPLTENEPKALQGKTYDPIEPTKTDSQVLVTSPPTSNGGTTGPDRDSLDEYEGSDDDFSEHGSFIGQYGNGKTRTSQSSLPSYV